MRRARFSAHCVCFCFLGPCVLLFLQEQVLAQAAPLDKILESWLRYRAAIRTIEFTYTIEDTSPSETGSDEAAEERITLRACCKIKGAMFRQDVSFPPGPRGETVSWIALYNGKDFQAFFSESGRLVLSKWPMFETEGCSANPLVMPFYFLRQREAALGWTALQDAELWKKRFADAKFMGMQRVDGLDCLVCEFPDWVVEGNAFRVYFSSSLGYYPLLQEVLDGSGNKVGSIKVSRWQLAESDHPVLIPLEVKLEAGQSSEGFLGVMRLDPKSLRVNHPVDDSDFTYPLEAASKVERLTEPWLRRRTSLTPDGPSPSSWLRWTRWATYIVIQLFLLSYVGFRFRKLIFVRGSDPEVNGGTNEKGEGNVPTPPQHSKRRVKLSRWLACLLLLAGLLAFLATMTWLSGRRLWRHDWSQERGSAPPHPLPLSSEPTPKLELPLEELVLIPGKGMGSLHFGDPPDKIRKVLGEPATVTTVGSGQQFWIYPKLGMRLVVTPRGLRVIEVSTAQLQDPTQGFSDFPGSTSKGVALGASEQEIIARYGKPSLREDYGQAGVDLTYINPPITFRLHKDRLTIILLTGSGQK